MEKHTQSDKKSTVLIIKRWEPLEESIKKERMEQERTRIKKKLFIELLPQLKGVISMTCAKTDITRATYYAWRDTDPEFADAVKKAIGDLNEQVEDVLMGKIFVDHDGPSIRFFLDRKHPNYKARLKVETQIVGDKTLEDLLDQDNAQPHGQENTQGTDRGTDQDPQQAGGDSAVQVQQGAGVLLEQKDASQPHSEGATEGHQ